MILMPDIDVFAGPPDQEAEVSDVDQWYSEMLADIGGPGRVPGTKDVIVEKDWTESKHPRDARGRFGSGGFTHEVDNPVPGGRPPVTDDAPGTANSGWVEYGDGRTWPPGKTCFTHSADPDIAAAFAAWGKFGDVKDCGVAATPDITVETVPDDDPRLLDPEFGQLAGLGWRDLEPWTGPEWTETPQVRYVKQAHILIAAGTSQANRLALVEHELGHTLGLGHPANDESLMSPGRGRGYIRADDAAGIRTLYPKTYTNQRVITVTASDKSWEDQPREPAGSPEGGQFAGGESSPDELAGGNTKVEAALMADTGLADSRWDTEFKNYATNDSMYINRMLREAEPGTHGGETSTVKRMDEAMAASRLSKDVTVYRRIGYLHYQDENVPRVGDVLQDKGYTSTTLLKPWVDQFQLADRAVIHVPAGHSAIYVPRVMGGHDPYDEKELLLPRGSRFRVTAVGEPNSHGAREYTYEVL